MRRAYNMCSVSHDTLRSSSDARHESHSTPSNVEIQLNLPGLSQPVCIDPPQCRPSVREKYETWKVGSAIMSRGRLGESTAPVSCPGLSSPRSHLVFAAVRLS